MQSAIFWTRACSYVISGFCSGVAALLITARIPFILVTKDSVDQCLK